MNPNSEWEPEPAVVGGGKGGKIGPAKIRVLRLGAEGRPIGIISLVAWNHLVDSGVGWVRVDRSRQDPRAIRLTGLRAAEPGAYRLRHDSHTMACGRLLRMVPPGTDILLELDPHGPNLYGRIPDDIPLPATAA